MAASDPNADAERLRLQRIMRRAMIRVRETVMNPPGGTGKAKTFAATQAAAKLRDLTSDLRVLTRKANRIVDAQVRESYQRGTERADQLARDAGLVTPGSPIAGALVGANTDRAGVLSRDAQTHITGAFVSMKDLAGRAVRQANALGLNNAKLRRLLAGGTIEGTSQQTRKDFLELVKRAQIGQVVVVPTRSGGEIHYTPEYYANMVYRTAMAEAANIATVERLAAQGQFYVKILGSNSTNFCTAFVSKVFWTGEGNDPLGHFPNYRDLPSGGPPFHPHCSKYPVPFDPLSSTAAEIEAAKLKAEHQAMLEQHPLDAQALHEETRDIKEPTDEPPVDQQSSPEASGTPKQPPEPLTVVTRPSDVVGARPIPVAMVDENGVQVVSIDVAHPATAESVVRTVERLRARGFEPPPTFIDAPELFDPIADANVMSAYLADEVVIDPTSRFWRQMPQLAVEQHAAGRWSSPDPDHPLLNEAGHHRHRASVGDARFNGYFNVLLPIEHRAAVIDDVSMYALRNIQEFVAETFAALMAGRQVSPQTMALYRFYGGVW